MTDDDTPRCICSRPVDNDGEWCETCSDAPHGFTAANTSGLLHPWCHCGRSLAASVHWKGAAA